MRKLTRSLALGLTFSMTLSVTAQANPTQSPAFPTLSFIAGLLNQPAFPKNPAYTTNDDIVIYGSDGVNLEANIFVPTAGTGPFPAIIFINSWALNEYEYLTEASRFAQQGYVVLSYTSRGWHTSGGAIDTAGPKDIDDFSRVIDWLIANAPVDPERIGAAGISYGSGISLIGAAHDERIKAVAALSTWGSLVEALYAQQTPRLVWGTLLTETAPIFGNPDPHIDSLWNSVLTHSNIEMVTAWAMQRSPIRYVDRLNANGTAVYFAKNWGDDLFQPNSILDMYSRLTGPKHIDLQAGTHASTEIFGMIGSGDTRIWNNTHRWFDKHLKGLPTAIDDQLPVQMKVKMTDRYEGFADWPVPNARQARWYLHPRSTFSPGELEDTPWQGRSPVENTLSSWADTLASTGIPLAAQMFEQIKVPVTTPILLLDRDRSTWFQTDRLSQPMKIRGIPTLKLQVTPQHDKAQLVAYLYDMNALGVGTLISHAPITVPQATPGKPLTLDIHLVATAYDVPKGNRLVLVVDTQDPLYKKVSNGTLRVDVDFSKERASVLEVPVL